MNTDGAGGPSPFSRDVRVVNCKCIEKQATPMVTGVVSVLQVGTTSTLTLISGVPFNSNWVGGIQVGSVGYPITSIPNTTTLVIDNGPPTTSSAVYNYSLTGSDQCVQFAFTKGGIASGNYIYGYGSGIQFWGGSFTPVSGLAATDNSGGTLTTIDGSNPFDTTIGSNNVGGTIQIPQVPTPLSPPFTFPTAYRITSVLSSNSVTISPVLPCPSNMQCPQTLSSVGFSGSLDNVTSPRLAQDIVVSNNVCEGCTIWGAYGQGILFNANRADGGYDVGFDLEGTIDSQIVGNNCSNMPNGCLAVFHSCRGILISGNVVKQDNAAFPMAPVYGDLFNCSNVDVVNNEFDGLDPNAPSPLVRTYGSANVRNFSYNKFNNAYAAVYFDSPVVNMIGNQFDYTISAPNPFNALLAFREDEFWPPAVIPSLFNIRDNTVTSLVTQPSGSTGIGCAFADGIHTGTGTCVVDANVFQGPFPLPVDISIGDGFASNNPSPPNGTFVNPTFIVTNNRLSGPEILVNFQGGFLSPPIMDIAGNLDTTTGHWYNTVTAGSGSFNPPSTTILGPDLFQVNPDLASENQTTFVSSPYYADSISNGTFYGCSGLTCANWGTSTSAWSFSGSGATWDGTTNSLLFQTAANAHVPILNGAYYDIVVDITAITGTPTLLVHGEFTAWNSGSGVAINMALGVQHLIVQAQGQQPYFSFYAQNAGTLTIAYVECNMLGGSGTFQNDIQVDNVPVYTSIAAAEADGMTPGQVFQNGSSELFVIPVFKVTGPAAPTGLTATAGSLSTELAWTASAGCPSCTYNVYDSTVSGGPYSLVANSGKNVTYNVTGLVAGTEYYFVVQGQNHAGVGPASAQANATPTP